MTTFSAIFLVLLVIGGVALGVFMLVMIGASWATIFTSPLLRWYKKRRRQP